jgi:hypothetical protein
MISHRCPPVGAPSTQNPRSPACDLDVTDRRLVRPDLRSLVKGEGDDSFTLIWSRRNGD